MCRASQVYIFVNLTFSICFRCSQEPPHGALKENVKYAAHTEHSVDVISGFFLIYKYAYLFIVSEYG